MDASEKIRQELLHEEEMTVVDKCLPISTPSSSLTSNNKGNITLKFHDETESIKRKYQTKEKRKYQTKEPEKDNFTCDTDWKKKLTANLHICKNAIFTEDEIISTLMKSTFLDLKNKYLQTFEEAAIRLATYPDCTEGVFAFTIFEHKKDTTDTPVYYIRYLESGWYHNFMTDTFINLFCELRKVCHDHIVLSEILTSDDQDNLKMQKVDRKTEKRSRPDKIYHNNIGKLKMASEMLILHAGNFEGIKLLYFIHVVKNKLKPTDKCYHQSNIENLDLLLDRLCDSLGSYPEGRPTEKNKMSRDFLNHLPEDSSMLEQSIHINMMSNDHSKYLTKGQVLRFQRRFSTDTNPASLRNKVLSCYKRNKINELFKTFEGIIPEKENAAFDHTDNDIPSK